MGQGGRKISESVVYVLELQRAVAWSNLSVWTFVLFEVIG